MFWIDEHGHPVRGPIGRYGGPPVLKLGALAATVLALVGLLLFVPFGGRDSATTVPSAPAPAPAPAESPSTSPSSGTTTRLPVGKPFGSSPDEVTETPGPTRLNPRAADPTTDWFPSATPTAPAPPWSAPSSPSTTEPGTPELSTPEPSTSVPSTSVPSTPGSSPSATQPTTGDPPPSPTGPSTPEPSTPEPSPSTTMEPTTTTPSTTPTYKNCAEVRAAGQAPLYRGDPGYTAALDRNGDGIACERGNS